MLEFRIEIANIFEIEMLISSNELTFIEIMYMVKKVRKTSELLKKVYNILLEKDKPMKPDEIALVLGVGKRSTRYAVNLLVEQGSLGTYPDLDDLRTKFYFIKKLQPTN